jgi:hypothetical protein
MGIKQQIEQHRRYLARREITVRALRYARVRFPGYVPSLGTNANGLLAWANAVETCARDLAADGRLAGQEFVDVRQPAALATVRARYVRSAAYDVPLVLDFRGTPIEALCQECAQATCECENGPTSDREDREPKLRPTAYGDRSALYGAGYAPCATCGDWLLPAASTITLTGIRYCAGCAAAADQLAQTRRCSRARQVAHERLVLPRRIARDLELAEKCAHVNERAVILRRIARRQKRLAQIGGRVA